MTISAKGYDRVTISLPRGFSKEIEQLQKEMNITKSELFSRAFQRYMQDHRKEKLQKIAESMAEEYRSDNDLTALSALDSEDFR